jgi:hypothetical protein
MGMRSFLIVLFLLSCDLNVDYFSDYSNVNLIPNLELSTTSGEWDLLTNNTPGDYDDDYMLFESVTTPGPSGAPAFRLEIKNMFPNGDFENALGAFWTLGGGSSSATIVNSNVNSGFFPAYQRTISSGDRSLKVVTEVANDFVGFDLTAANFGPALVPTGTYIIKFDYRFYTRFYVQYYRNNGTVYDDHQTVIKGVGLQNAFQLDTNFPQLESFPGTNLILPITIKSSGTHRFNFGFNTLANSPGAPDVNKQIAMIDNVRMVRTNVDMWLESKVPNLNATALPLLPGIYEFTLWVLQENTSDVSPNNPPTHTRFRAPGITIEIITQEATGIQTRSQYFTDTGWSSWTKLTFRIENVQFDNATFSSSHPAIVIRLSPNRMNGSFNQRDSGSLLISSPALFFKER